MIGVTLPDFEDISDDILDEVTSEAEILVTKIFSRVVKYSPVLRGHFRASWRVATDTVDTSFIREGGTEFNPLPAPSVPKITIGDDLPIVTISNSSPHADLIENGSSQKAPSGVLDITLTELGLL